MYMGKKSNLIYENNYKETNLHFDIELRTFSRFY